MQSSTWKHCKNWRDAEIKFLNFETTKGRRRVPSHSWTVIPKRQTRQFVLPQFLITNYHVSSLRSGFYRKYAGRHRGVWPGYRNRCGPEGKDHRWIPAACPAGRGCCGCERQYAKKLCPDRFPRWYGLYYPDIYRRHPQPRGKVWYGAVKLQKNVRRTKKRL